MLFIISSFMLPTNLFQLIYSNTLTYTHLWLNCYYCPTLSRLSYVKTGLGSWVQVCFILKHLSQESVLNNVCEFLYLIKMGDWVLSGLSEQKKKESTCFIEVIWAFVFKLHQLFSKAKKKEEVKFCSWKGTWYICLFASAWCS